MLYFFQLLILLFLIINIFCTLVFNEVLILNFCKLDLNTKKRIEERMKADENFIKDEHLTSEDEKS